MSEENEGLLAYFQRMLTKLLASCTSETGFSSVTDDYLGTMMVDSIERILNHGRREAELQSTEYSSWQVLKAGVDKAQNMDLLLAMHTRSLERRAGLSPFEKSTLFFQYSIMNKVLSAFCASLVKNTELISKFYFPGCIMASPEHSGMFVLQLSTLESLNFSAIWGGEGIVNLATNEEGPQRTIVLQSEPTPPTRSATSSLPGSLQLPLSENKASQNDVVAPAPVRSFKMDRPAPVLKDTASTLFGTPSNASENANSTLFGGFDASVPLTFSLKPKNTTSAAPTPSFTHAFVPITSTPASSSTLSNSSSTLSSTSSSTLQMPRVASTHDLNASGVSPRNLSPSPSADDLSNHRSNNGTPSPTPPASLTLAPPAENPYPRKGSQSLPPPDRSVSPQPEEAFLAATVEAPPLSNPVAPGSAKKRAKKRTIDL